MNPLVVVTSPKGGAGTTTVAAALAIGLVGFGWRTLAADFDPRNALRLHLGVDAADPRGLLSRLYRAEPVANCLLPAADAARVLPFGRAALAELPKAERVLVERPLELFALLKRDFSAEGQTIIVDAPSAPAALRLAAARAADLEICVLDADGGSFAAASPGEALLPPVPEGRRLFVLNRADAEAQFQRNVQTALTRLAGGAVAAVLPRDEAVAEALGRRQTVLTWDPEGESARILFQLAADVDQRLRARAPARPSRG